MDACIRRLALAVVFVLAAGSRLAAAEPLGTAFTYQGQLRQEGIPLNGACDLQFSLWDAAAGGIQVGTTQAADDVAVTEGLFTVTLDFGAAAAPTRP